LQSVYQHGYRLDRTDIKGDRHVAAKSALPELAFG
jgi:hypothetical protein